jgi:hypothetical protein
LSLRLPPWWLLWGGCWWLFALVGMPRMPLV